MLPIRAESGQGYSAGDPTEWQYLSGTVRVWQPSSWVAFDRPTIYCHGSGDTALTPLAKAGQRELIRSLSQRSLVLACDLGLQAWGNDTHIARIGEAKEYIESRFEYFGSVNFVAVSMGALGALAYILQNPTHAAAVAGVIPAVDIADAMLRGAAADINAAYGGAYDDEVDGPTHSPVHFASQLPEDLPIRLFTSSNDAITVPATADAFVAARPQTTRVDIGTQGHSENSVTASIIPVREFFEEL